MTVEPVPRPLCQDAPDLRSRGEELRRGWCTRAVSIELQPPTEAAGIRIGATREEAHRQCLAHGEPTPFRRASEVNASLVVHRPSGLSIFVYFDVADGVEAIEFGRPRSRDVVSFRGIDIFDTPADEVLMKLGEHTSIEVDEDGRSATARHLPARAVAIGGSPRATATRHTAGTSSPCSWLGPAHYG